VRFASTVPPIPRHAIFISNQGAAEDIEGASEGEVDAIVAVVRDGLQVLQRPATTGVGAGDGGALAEQADQGFLDAFAFALDIGRVNQVFAAVC